MTHPNNDQNTLHMPLWLEDSLKEYVIDGDIGELNNVIFSNALIAISFNDVISALSKAGNNHVITGYGTTLAEAYNNAAVRSAECRLVHIYFSKKLGISDIYNFTHDLGEDIIFGYTEDRTMECGIKLVMIFN